MSEQVSLESLGAARECALFHGMSDADLTRLLSTAERREVAVGEMVVRHGELGNELMVILDGQCEVRNSMSDLLAVLEAGALLGEVGFIDGEGRSANVVASSPAVVLAFRDGLLASLKDVPELRAQLIHNLAKVLCQKLRWTTRLAEASFV